MGAPRFFKEMSLAIKAWYSGEVVSSYLGQLLTDWGEKEISSLVFYAKFKTASALGRLSGEMTALTARTNPYFF